MSSVVMAVNDNAMKRGVKELAVLDISCRNVSTREEERTILDNTRRSSIKRCVIKADDTSRNALDDSRYSKDSYISQPETN